MLEPSLVAIRYSGPIASDRLHDLAAYESFEPGPKVESEPEPEVAVARATAVPRGRRVAPPPQASAISKDKRSDRRISLEVELRESWIVSSVSSRTER